MDNDNKQFYHNVHKNLLIENKADEDIPILVYLLLTPMMSLQFMNHIMLSIGRYATYNDLSLHGSMGKQLWNAKPIVINYDEESLQICSN